MSDQFFLDTNILIYAILESPDSLSKKLVARNILSSHSKSAVISAQILNEFHSVMLRHGVAESTIRIHIQDIASSAEVRPIDIMTIYTAWNIRDEYSLSLWDGFVVASALLAGCGRLYSEDMRDGLVVKETLTITNPFKMR